MPAEAHLISAEVNGFDHSFNMLFSFQCGCKGVKKGRMESGLEHHDSYLEERAYCYFLSSPVTALIALTVSNYYPQYVLHFLVFLFACTCLLGPSFGGEVKPSVPCRRFTACRRTLRARYVIVGKIQRPCFSPAFHLLRC
jgi:hypothetical protein